MAATGPTRLAVPLVALPSDAELSSVQHSAVEGADHGRTATTAVPLAAVVMLAELPNVNTAPLRAPIMAGPPTWAVPPLAVVIEAELAIVTSPAERAGKLAAAAKEVVPLPLRPQSDIMPRGLVKLTLPELFTAAIEPESVPEMLAAPAAATDSVARKL